MTTSRRLWILLCVVLLLALLAVLNAGRLIDPDTSSSQPPLLDGLADQLARVQRVRMTTADGVVTLEKQPSGWGIAERAGYPARISTLSELLNALALATQREAMTSRAENLGRLGLDDPEVPETGASWVEIWLDDEAPQFSVLLGADAEGRGRYARIAASAQAWLVDPVPLPEANPAAWIDPSLLPIEFERVSALQRIGPDDNAWSALKSADSTSLVPSALPNGQQLRYASVIDGSVRAALNLRIEDVIAAATHEIAPDAGVLNQITLRDGIRLDIRAYTHQGANWVQISAAMAELRPDDATSPSADVDAELASLNQRLSGWAFRVSDYAYGELSNGLEAYIEDIPAVEETDASTPTTPIP